MNDEGVRCYKNKNDLLSSPPPAPLPLFLHPAKDGLCQAIDLLLYL